MRKQRLLLWLAALLGVSMALSGCTSDGATGDKGAGGTGDSVLSQVLERGTIRVAVLPDFPPASSQNAQGEFEGYEPAIAKKLADALGVKLELVSSNGDTRLSLMKSGRADVNISSYTATNERAQSVTFTIPYIAQGANVLYSKDNPISGFDDLAGKKIAVARGSTNDTIATEGFPKSKVVRFDTIADAITALKSGKVDAAMESFTIVNQTAEDNPGLEALADQPYRPRLISMGILPGDPVWKSYLDNFIRNLIATGQNAELYEHWFHSPVPDVVHGLPPQNQG